MLSWGTAIPQLFFDYISITKGKLEKLFCELVTC
jgi:hypothetical protein